MLKVMEKFHMNPPCLSAAYVACEVDTSMNINTRTLKPFRCRKHGLLFSTIESTKELLLHHHHPYFFNKGDTFPSSLLSNCRSITTLDCIFARLFASGFLHKNTPMSLQIAQKYASFGHPESSFKVFCDTHLWHNTRSSNALISTLLKQDKLQFARQVFDKMRDLDVVSWSSMIHGFSRLGQSSQALFFFQNMRLSGIDPNRVTVLGVVSAYADIGDNKLGMGIHSFIIKAGIHDDNESVMTALVGMYFKCDDATSANKVFESMNVKDVIAWTAIISGHSQLGFAKPALNHFYEMVRVKCKPNKVTFASIIPAISQLRMLKYGMQLHGYIVKLGWDLDLLIVTSLMTMYVQCGESDIAFELFNGIRGKDVVVWNAMISAFGQIGGKIQAMKMFQEMLLSNMVVNSATILAILSAVSCLRDSESIHGYGVKTGLENDLNVGNAFLTTYGKCGMVDCAFKLFNKMLRKNVVSWSAMISLCTQNGHATEALCIFEKFTSTGMRPNNVTFLNVLQACSELAALEKGKKVHKHILESGIRLDVALETALVEMYSKCGQIQVAKRMFDDMVEKDLMTWNTMISCYGIHGLVWDAYEIFEDMQLARIKPDATTFTCLLSACSHAGSVKLGWECFNSCQEFDISHTMEHYACMVDILGRAGLLKEAETFIKEMPLEPDNSIWNALLSACKTHGNVALGEWASKQVFESSFQNAGTYILVSNLYASAGMWEKVAEARNELKNKKLKKAPGCSWIEVDSNVHKFVAGDTSHPQLETLYSTLQYLLQKMKLEGYVIDTTSVLHDIPQEQKEFLLLGHSEKLAIAFGLLNTSPGMSLQVTKNLRICADCHNFVKHVSKITSREIIVRDTKRFHKFVQGYCNCGDYW